MIDPEPPQEVWLSGNEHIQLVSELFGEKPELQRSGRTKRLAAKYAELAMMCPGNKVIVYDHHNIEPTNRACFHLTCRVLDTLQVEYEIGQINIIEYDASFTGAKHTGRKQYYIVVTPPKELPF